MLQLSIMSKQVPTIPRNIHQWISSEGHHLQAPPKSQAQELRIVQSWTVSHLILDEKPKSGTGNIHFCPGKEIALLQRVL